MLRWWLFLLAPLGASALLGAPLADRLGVQFAERLASVARILLPRAPALVHEPKVTEAPSPAPAPLPALALEAKVSAPAPRGGAKTKAARPRGPLPGLRVPKAVVLSLAERRMTPSGKPVPAQGGRPPGIALFGVGALGLGVLDGDVLTEVEGRPARAPGQVIDAIVRARGRRADTISGVLYRGQERFVLVVEQPY